jgi:hypothetical protein
MLHDMNNMKASCVFYVKVGMFTNVEQSKISILTFNETGLIRLMIHHDIIVSVRFMYHPGNHLRHTSAIVLSIEQCPIYI